MSIYRLDRFNAYLKENSPPLQDTVREKFNQYVETLHRRLAALKEKDGEEEEHKVVTATPNSKVSVNIESEETNGKKKKEKRIYTKENRELYKAEAILRRRQEKRGKQQQQQQQQESSEWVFWFTVCL